MELYKAEIKQKTMQNEEKMNIKAGSFEKTNQINLCNSNGGKKSQQ